MCVCVCMYTFALCGHIRINGKGRIGASVRMCVHVMSLYIGMIIE